jgi:hypothetical protein
MTYDHYEVEPVEPASLSRGSTVMWSHTATSVLGVTVEEEATTLRTVLGELRVPAGQRVLEVRLKKELR